VAGIGDLLVPHRGYPSRRRENEIAGATVLRGETLQDRITAVPGPADDVNDDTGPEKRSDSVASMTGGRGFDHGQVLLHVASVTVGLGLFSGKLMFQSLDALGRLETITLSLKSRE